MQPFERSRRWLLGLARDSGEAMPLRPVLQIVLGVSLCERALGLTTPSEDFTKVLASVEELLARSAGSFDGYAYDAKLLFLCHRIVRDAGFDAGVLEDFSREIGATIDSLPEVPAAYAAEALLLSQLGLCRPPPEGAGGDASEIRSDLGLLRADRAAIRGLARGVEAVTCFGTRAFLAPRDDVARLAWILRVVVLQALRDYDLELGALLLRALTYLGDDAVARAGIALEYLADQQQADGRFGYLAREIARLEGGAADADRRIHLPLTVACSWTLAEATVPGFRLLGRCARPADEGGAALPGASAPAASAAATPA